MSISADFVETGVALITPARLTATFGLATELLITDHRQQRPQPLVEAHTVSSTQSAMRKIALFFG